MPLTAGTRRTPLDVLLYAGVLGSAIFLLAANGDHIAGTAAGRLPQAGIAVLLGFLVLLGLRDKVSFLGARPEIYATMLAVGLFPPTSGSSPGSSSSSSSGGAPRPRSSTATSPSSSR